MEEQPHPRWRNLKFTRFLRKEAEERVKEERDRERENERERKRDRERE